MLGNVSVSVDVNFDTGEEVGKPVTSFSAGGRLINPTLKTPQNKTLSAIIALERLGVGGREFLVKVEAKEQADQRRIGLETRNYSSWKALA